MGKPKRAYKKWQKPEGKRPPGRVRRRWDSNININLQDIECVAFI
jgi:hypothetical protein